MQIAFNSQLNMTNGIINCKKTEHHKKEYLKVWRSIYSILDQNNFIGKIVSYITIMAIIGDDCIDLLKQLSEW